MADLVLPDRVVVAPVDARRGARAALAGEQAGDQSADHRGGGAAAAAGAGRVPKGAGRARGAGCAESRRRGVGRVSERAAIIPRGSAPLRAAPRPAPGRRCVHGTDRPADEPQRRQAHRRGHPPHLPVLAFVEGEPSQAVGIALRTRIGGSRGHSPGGSSITRTAIGAVTKSPRSTPAASAAELRRRRHALDLRPVDLRVPVPAVGDARLQRAVGGQHDQALAVGVEAARRIDAGDGNELRERGLAAAVGRELAQHAVRLVQQHHVRGRAGGADARVAAGRRGGAWQASSESRIIDGLPHAYLPVRKARSTQPRRVRPSSGGPTRALHGEPNAQLPARQSPGRRPEDHRQQGFQPRRFRTSRSSPTSRATAPASTSRR